MVDSLLSEENVRSRGLFSYSYVNKLIQENLMSFNKMQEVIGFKDYFEMEKKYAKNKSHKN